MNLNLFKDFRIYSPYLVILIPAFGIQFGFTQNEISIFVNNHWNDMADMFCKYYTHLGDGWFAIALGLLITTKNRKLGLILLASYAASSLFTQFLKHFVFEDMNRPTWVMRERIFHLVDGVEVYAFNSFPSGHSTTAFSLATTFACYFRKSMLSTLFYLMASLVAFSRVYLLEHFFQDTLAASMIGVFFTMIVCSFLIKENNDLKQEE